MTASSSTKCLIFTCAMIISKYFVTLKYMFAFHWEEFYFPIVMDFQVPRRIWERLVCFFLLHNQYQNHCNLVSIFSRHHLGKAFKGFHTLRMPKGCTHIKIWGTQKKLQTYLDHSIKFNFSCRSYWESEYLCHIRYHRSLKVCLL